MATCKCKCCQKPVKDSCRAFECDVCVQWYHLKCTVLSIKGYNCISRTNDLSICLSCTSDIFPFHSLDYNDLIELSFNSNIECLCSNRIANLNYKLDTLPCFDIMATIDKN